MTGDRSECKNSPDDFCYVCGQFNLSVGKKPITRAHENAYLAYFGFNICDQNSQWVPHVICKDCHLGLLKWMNGCGGSLAFSAPMCWRQPQNHSIDCYFCLTRINDDTGKVEYANDVISVTKPIANREPVNIPEPYHTSPPARTKPIEHLILPNELDLLISGFNLSERSAEILVKIFQEWKVLAPFPSFHRRKAAEVM